LLYPSWKHSNQEFIHIGDESQAERKITLDKIVQFSFFFIIKQQQ